jgi:hypothetical protein
MIEEGFSRERREEESSGEEGMLGGFGLGGEDWKQELRGRGENQDHPIPILTQNGSRILISDHKL